MTSGHADVYANTNTMLVAGLQGLWRFSYTSQQGKDTIFCSLRIWWKKNRNRAVNSASPAKQKKSCNSTGNNMMVILDMWLNVILLSSKLTSYYNMSLIVILRCPVVI